MYLGLPDGRAPFIGGVIENNVISDSLGYNLQIKHQRERPRIEGLPEGASVTIIRHNVFTKSANSSTGELARPNLLVGHWPTSGPGADDTYAIYGNFLYQNPTEALFQGEGNIAFYSNVLVNSTGDTINIQPHNDVPRRVDIFRNTVLAADSGIRVTAGHADYAQRVMANAVFAATPIAGGEQHATTAPLARAADHLAEPFAAPGQLDLAPRPGAPVLAASISRRRPSRMRTWISTAGLSRPGASGRTPLPTAPSGACASGSSAEGERARADAIMRGA
jgi:hypothetical protein